jgi:putative sigma-54 modulation protein
VQVKISVRHGTLSEETHQMIREKAEKLLHYFERLTLIEVTVDMGKNGDKGVEFVVQAEHKHNIVGADRHHNLMAAVDLAMTKLEAQIRRYKEKIQDHRRTPSTGAGGGAGGRTPHVEEPADE